MMYKRVLMLGLTGLFMAGLHAQDITLQAPIWSHADDAPDELPSLSKVGASKRAENGLTDISDPAYREVIWLVGDEKSPILVRLAEASGSVFLDASYNPFLTASFDAPAKRDGRPVVSEVRVIAIFNPKSAESKSPNATPRLLEVVPAQVPPKESKNDKRLSSIEARLEIDATGKVTSAVFPATTPAGYARSAERAVKRWTFAPAREAGQPVAGQISINVLFVSAKTFQTAEVQTPPKVKKTQTPVYPFAMKRANLVGKVVVGFVVDVEGRTRNVYAIKSDNPNFEESAIESVSSWTFEPGKIDGKPVNTRMQVPIVFNIDGGGTSMFSVKRPKKFPEGFPEAFQFDRPPEVTRVEMPVYPFEALRDGRGGKVLVNFAINPAGQIESAQVKNPTGLDIEEAARTAVETFEFKPAIKDGKPCYALISMEFNFKKNGQGDVDVSSSSLRIMRLIKDNSPKLVPLTDLDSMPKPLSRRPPSIPISLRKSGVDGEAMVEFVIDRRGIARVPRVVSATDPALGFAAVQAIATWRFEAPTFEGKAVDAIARIPVKFSFDPKK